MDISEQQPQLPDENNVDVHLEKLCLPTGASFDEWTSLIANTEENSPVDIEKVSLLYDSFLSEFPLCYGYWRKYAGHKARLGTVDKVLELYERAVQSATYSVDLWVDYCSFGMLLIEDPVNVRRLFDRGMSFVGKDYLCNRLWDKYIEFEYSQKNWSSLAHIYVRTLKYPTKKLRSYYDSFKKLATILEDEIKLQSNDTKEVQSDATPNGEVAHEKVYDAADVTSVVRDLLDPAVGLGRLSALEKYLSIGEQFYQEASDMDTKICVFENRIRRSYFHVKPLDVSQLENWHQYLDFIEMHGDFDWTVKLHERCLIPCANYPEFWMRYTEFMETKGGREIANLALVRATQIFLKRVPSIHIFCARFKEKIGDVVGSRAAYRQCNTESDSDFIANVQREANMENRLGNTEAAFHIYEEALQVAIEKQKSHIFSRLSVHFSRYKYMVTGNVNATRDVLIKGVQHLPHCKLLIQELLNFEMLHKGLNQMNIVDSIVTRAICPGVEVSQGLSNKDREDISTLYIEFLDHCGTIHDVMEAWNRHRKLFPHLMRPTVYDPAERQDMAIVLPHHTSGDENPHGSVQQVQLDQKPSPVENPETQPDLAPTSQSQMIDTCSMEERIQTSASPNNAEQSGQDLDEQNEEANNLMDEVPNGCQALITIQENPEGVNEVQEKSDYDAKNELRPPSLATLSLSPRNDETPNSIPTTSHGCETLQASPRANGSSQHYCDYTRDNSPLRNLTCTKVGSQDDVQSDYGLPHVPKDSSSLQEVHQHPQPVLPTSSTVDHRVVKEESWHMIDNGAEAHSGVPVSHDPQHHRHVQNPPQPQYQSSSMHHQTFGTQNFPAHPQPWQNPPMQPINQAQNQYQVAASQVQPMSAYQWPAQNMQQQYFGPAPQPQPQPQPQTVPESGLYAQAQAYQYPVQSNVQYVQMQGNQEYTPQMWHYYYQQQQQHQQQLQQYAMLQTQTWNANYYQQQPPMQHYGASQYGQQVVISQGQGTTQQNIVAPGPSTTQCPQQIPPSS